MSGGVEDAMGEDKVHYAGRIDLEAGRGACGLRLADFQHSPLVGRVTCPTCRTTSSFREAAGCKKNGPPQILREMQIVIHGARGVGKTVLQARIAEFLRSIGGRITLLDGGKVFHFKQRQEPIDPFFVTIDTSCFPTQKTAAELKAGGSFDGGADVVDALRAAYLAPALSACASPNRPVHYDFGAGAAICCTGMRAADDRTQNLSRVTCVECLRHKVRMQEEECGRMRGVAQSGDALVRSLEEEIRARDARIEALERKLAEARAMACAERAAGIGHVMRVMAEVASLYNGRPLVPPHAEGLK